MVRISGLKVLGRQAVYIKSKKVSYPNGILKSSQQCIQMPTSTRDSPKSTPIVVPEIRAMQTFRVEKPFLFRTFVQTPVE